MNFRYLIILILPIILHIKSSPVIIVFLIMNSIISLLMEYTKMEVRMLGHIIENKDIIERLMNDDVKYDESFKEHLEKEDIYLPKPIEFAANMSISISLIGIIAGVIRLIK